MYFLTQRMMYLSENSWIPYATLADENSNSRIDQIKVTKN